MSNLCTGPDPLSKMEDTLSPASPSDALLPNKGEPEKTQATLKTTLSSRAESMNKVLMKASSLTRRRNSQNSSDHRPKGKLYRLWILQSIFNQKNEG